MKLNICSLLGAFLIVGTVSLFVGCEGFTTSDPSQILLPGPPQNLRATAIDTATLKFKWDVSADVGVVQRYVYTLTDSKYRVIDSGSVGPQTTEYIRSGLEAGEVYRLTIWSESADTVGPKASLSWSPALVFKTVNGDPIKITPSNPGLTFYDALLQAPKTSGMSGITDWDVAIYFASDTLWLTPPKQYPPVVRDETFDRNILKSVSFSDLVFVGVSSVDEMYGSQAFSNGIFDGKVKDLKNYSQNVGFVLKIVSQTGETRYAKILLKNVNGSFLQGSGGEEYVECEIAYQLTPEIPYALAKKLEQMQSTP